MSYQITLIPGDGIGPEVTAATRKVIEATGVKIDWDVQDAGLDVHAKEGTPLPQRVLDSLKRNKIGLKGPITTPVGTGFRSVNVALRQELKLYACIRPGKSYPGAPSHYENLDLFIVRENTEDLYAGIEFAEGTTEAQSIIAKVKELGGKSILPDSGIGIKPISIQASERIIRYAFDYAQKNQRRKVTLVHKANIMKFTDGLFLKVGRELAPQYPDIEFEDRIVDNMCMQLVQKPDLYDVLVLPNLYGDILSDLMAGLIGGLGLAPGGNIGEGIALFEPTHGSAPKYKGMNKANPMAMMLSGVMMLNYLGEVDAAQRLENAIAAVIKAGKDVTYDLKKDRNDPTAATTSRVAEAICELL